MKKLASFLPIMFFALSLAPGQEEGVTIEKVRVKIVFPKEDDDVLRSDEIQRFLVTYNGIIPGVEEKIYWRAGDEQDVRRDVREGKRDEWHEMTYLPETRQYEGVVDLKGWTWEPSSSYRIVAFAIDSKDHMVFSETRHFTVQH